MEQEKDIKQFIVNIVDKNYVEAKETVQKMVENKLKDRIKQTLADKK